MSHPSPLAAIQHRALALRHAGDLTGARRLLTDTVASAAPPYGPDHPDVLSTAHLLARLHREADDPAAARRVLEEAFAAGERRWPHADPLMLALSFELATVADELGNRHEARRNYRRVATAGPAVLGADHPAVREARTYLGEAAPAPADRHPGTPPTTATAPPPRHPADPPLPGPAPTGPAPTGLALADPPPVGPPLAGPPPAGPPSVDRPPTATGQGGAAAGSAALTGPTVSLAVLSTAWRPHDGATTVGRATGVQPGQTADQVAAPASSGTGRPAPGNAPATGAGVQAARPAAVEPDAAPVHRRPGPETPPTGRPPVAPHPVSGPPSTGAPSARPGPTPPPGSSTGWDSPTIQVQQIEPLLADRSTISDATGTVDAGPPASRPAATPHPGGTTDNLPVGPVSGPPVSGPPQVTFPVSGPPLPVSAPPVSGPPFPVSAPPASGPPSSAPPVSGPPSPTSAPPVSGPPSPTSGPPTSGPPFPVSAPPQKRPPGGPEPSTISGSDPTPVSSAPVPPWIMNGSWAAGAPTAPHGQPAGPAASPSGTVPGVAHPPPHGAPAALTGPHPTPQQTNTAQTGPRPAPQQASTAASGPATGGHAPPPYPGAQPAPPGHLAGPPPLPYSGQPAEGGTLSAYPVVEPVGRGRNRTAGIAVVGAVGVAVAAVSAGVVLLGRDEATPPSAAPLVSVAPEAAAPTVTAPTGPPTDLRLRDDSATITLSWTDPSGGTVPFMVAAGRAGQGLGVLARVDPGQTSYTVNGLSSRVDYCFTVLAVYSTDTFATSGQVCTDREG